VRAFGRGPRRGGRRPEDRRRHPHLGGRRTPTAWPGGSGPLKVPSKRHHALPEEGQVGQQGELRRVHRQRRGSGARAREAAGHPRVPAASRRLRSAFVPGASGPAGRLRAGPGPHDGDPPRATQEGRRVPMAGGARALLLGVKSALTSPMCVRFFDPSKRAEILTDASRLKGLGFALTQMDGDKRTLIKCGSRSLNGAESRYATLELEALAIKWAISSCKHYLMGGPTFTVVTDHKPLVPMFKKGLET
jgi:hypothetical protein